MMKINKILCPVDFFPASEKAVLYAAGLAANYGAKVHLLHVVAPVAQTAYEYPLNLADIIKAMEETSAIELKRLVAKLKARGVKVESEVRSGDIQDTIKRSMSVLKPDLVAMGTHGRRGLGRWMMGSVTEWMMRHSPVPVLTISAKEGITEPAFRRILITTDFSEGAVDALAYALSIAQANKSRITLLHVIGHLEVEVPSSYRDALVKSVQKQLDDLLPANARNRSDVAIRVEQGVPYRIILRILQNEKPDLLVMNIHGKGILDRALLGSTAERVVRAALCPVMLIPPMKKAQAAPKPRRTKRTARLH